MLATAALLLTGCNCFKKMRKNVDRVNVVCTPELVTLKGNLATTTYTMEFPANYFKKTSIVKITPVLVSANGEIAGAPKYVQGENVQDNYTVIPMTGGKITETVAFPYDQKMRQSTLELRLEAKCQKGSKKVKVYNPFAVIVIANGVSTVQEMANDFARLALLPDNFKRVTQISQDAKIMFKINEATVRPAQLNSEDIKLLQDFIKENTGDPKKKVSNVYTKAYASPDGPLNFNDKLSSKRGETTQKAVSKKFSKDKTPAEKFDVEAMGEDWEGFKELVEASNIPDKNLILNVLSMYSNPEVRDSEIKNMTAAFNVLKEKILPELRRSKMIVDVDVEGLTDAELKEAVSSDIKKLNLEETLFAATLYTDNETKAMIYKSAADRFNDYRAWNNYGVMLANMGKTTDAKDALMKAAKMNNTTPQVVNNMGVIALSEGNVAEAKRMFSSINTPESKYNMGLVALAEGDYATAVKTLDGYNLAVAEICNGNLSKAKSILANENCAYADYLKAVIAAREGNDSQVVANLTSAFAKNPSLKALAKTDVEFQKWFGVKEFISIVA